MPEEDRFVLQGAVCGRTHPLRHPVGAVWRLSAGVSPLTPTSCSNGAAAAECIRDVCGVLSLVWSHSPFVTWFLKEKKYLR
jgi:hypothetical protein